MSTDNETIHLSDEQIAKIADKAAEIVRNDVYVTVGKTIINKLSWLVGMGIVGVAVYMIKHGLIKIE